MTIRFAFMLGMVAVGVLIGRVAGHVTDILGGPFYSPFVAFLLALGLYGSTRAIDLRHLRSDLRTVVLAVTVGVFLKAVLITAVMLAVFQNPAYLVLGVAVAQIDPLSVSALGESSRLSRRGRGLLLAWASFDDPVTTLLTVYAAALALPFRDTQGAAHPGFGGSTFTVDLLGNLAVAVAAVLLHRLVRRAVPRWEFPVACLLLAAVFAIGTWQMWVLAVALVGLGIRPAARTRPDVADRALARSIDVAFLLASVLLGVVLSLGVSPLPGLVLGAAAFAAHALVSLPLTRSQSAQDRALLAFAQQNGITAIILALLLEPVFEGTVAVVAPAILVVNLLYLAANGLHARRAGTTEAAPAGAAASGPAGPAGGVVPADPVGEVAEQGVHVRLWKPEDVARPD
jgi:NhaP-type Na+/H+ or K+/H+ antiporter